MSVRETCGVIGLFVVPLCIVLLVADDIGALVLPRWLFAMLLVGAIAAGVAVFAYLMPMRTGGSEGPSTEHIRGVIESRPLYTARVSGRIGTLALGRIRIHAAGILFEAPRLQGRVAILKRDIESIRAAVEDPAHGTEIHHRSPEAESPLLVVSRDPEVRERLVDFART